MNNQPTEPEPASHDPIDNPFIPEDKPKIEIPPLNEEIPPPNIARREPTDHETLFSVLSFVTGGYLVITWLLGKILLQVLFACLMGSFTGSSGNCIGFASVILKLANILFFPLYHLPLQLHMFFYIALGVLGCFFATKGRKGRLITIAIGLNIIGVALCIIF